LAFRRRELRVGDRDLVAYVRPTMSIAAAMTSELVCVVVEVTCAANV
jgi:hypothetical protein